MKKFILIFISLFAVLCFDISAQIIKKYKDGVSIDSLVVKWPRLNYSDVVAMLTDQGIKFEERSFSTFDLNDQKVMKVYLLFHKVYYKGIFIGNDGHFDFENVTEKDMFNKKGYVFKQFSCDERLDPAYIHYPSDRDLLAAYKDLRKFYSKRYRQAEEISHADSLLTDESDVEMTFEYLEDSKEVLYRRWGFNETKDQMTITLSIKLEETSSRPKRYLTFFISWYPEYVPDKKNGMKRK